jgi:hypothetical protein
MKASAIALGVSTLVASDSPLCGDALYMAPEDGGRRVQRRMTKHFGALRDNWPSRRRGMILVSPVATRGMLLKLETPPWGVSGRRFLSGDVCHIARAQKLLGSVHGNYPWELLRSVW